MKMQSEKALTMVELLLTLVISSVLILMIGSISNIALGSHKQLKEEGDVYSDLYYGLSQISFLARKATLLKPDNTWPSPLNCNTLFVDYPVDPTVDPADPSYVTYQCAFGLYLDGQNMKLIYVPDISLPASKWERKIILEKIDITPRPLFFVTAISGQSVRIDIEGTKNKEAFKISDFRIKRRNN